MTSTVQITKPGNSGEGTRARAGSCSSWSVREGSCAEVTSELMPNDKKSATPRAGGAGKEQRWERASISEQAGLVSGMRWAEGGAAVGMEAPRGAGPSGPQ